LLFEVEDHSNEGSCLMTPCFSLSSLSRLHSISQTSAWKVFAPSLCVWLVLACSSEPDEPTEALPPVIVGEKVTIQSTASGVAVLGEPGAVTSSARVDVVNASTGQAVTTTAAAAGSFELELGGTPMDPYRIYVTVGEQSSRAVSSFGSTGDGELGLAGLEFSSIAATGFTLATDTTISLTFDYSALSFEAGCNNHSAPYSLCDGRLCASDFRVTAIGCDPILQAQDEWMAAFFGSSPRLSRQGPRLTLAGDDASLEFIESSLLNPDRPLTGRTWTIDTLIAADQARSLSLEPTISFQTNGTLQVFTTCTTGSGIYAAGEPTLAITNMEYIEKPCDASGDASIDEPIRRVLGDGDLVFEIDAARLTITRGRDGLQAQTD
jgi:heat shock protein HslJ